MMQTEEVTRRDKAPTIDLLVSEDKRATKVVDLATGQQDSHDEPEEEAKAPGCKRRKITQMVIRTSGPPRYF